MSTTHHEVEHTYDPPRGAAMPDLTALPGVATMAETGTVELVATYFDTAALDLVAAGVTLRRRTGGGDEGWHLKVPSGQGGYGRDEVHVPLARATRRPPKPLREAVTAWTRGAALSAFATVRTRRTTHLLHDQTGRVLAEAVDDHVEAEVHLDGGTVAWREWEVELAEGDLDLLAEVDTLMHSCGALVADIPRKITRVLGDRTPAAPTVKKSKPSGPAGRVLQRRLATQVAELKVRDCEVRRDTDDGVHQARVAMRRLRAALATFRPLVDRSVTDPIRDELRWASQVLGHARDAEIVQGQLRASVDEEPGGLVDGPVRRRLDRELSRRYREARDTALAAMRSERYLALLESLDQLVADPPWTSRAGSPADDVLPQRLRQDVARVRDRWERARAIEDLDARAAALHEVRQAAKRLRYAAEAVRPAYGKDAKRLAKQAKRLQSALGDHHDTVTARAALWDIAAAAAARGEDTFTHGRVHARLEEEARRHEQHAAEAWRKLSAGRATAWLH